MAVFTSGKRQTDMEVILGPESGIKGEVRSKGTVRIDGSFEGTVTADCVIIGETGVVSGDLSVASCIIGGKLDGNIRATESVEVRSKGVICGDIYSPRLVMAEGARFDGRSYMQRQQQGEIEYIAADEPVRI